MESQYLVVRRVHTMSLLRFFHGCPQMGEVSVFVGEGSMSAPIARGLAYGESTPHIFMHGGHTTIRVEEEGKVRVQNHVIIPENQSFTLMWPLPKQRRSWRREAAACVLRRLRREKNF